MVDKYFLLTKKWFKSYYSCVIIRNSVLWVPEANWEIKQARLVNIVLGTAMNRTHAMSFLLYLNAIFLFHRRQKDFVIISTTLRTTGLGAFITFLS